MLFICYPKCTTCQKAKNWLCDNGIKFEKRFDAKTSTGDVNIPVTTSGGRCKIVTSTGDINFR